MIESISQEEWDKIPNYDKIKLGCMECWEEVEKNRPRNRCAFTHEEKTMFELGFEVGFRWCYTLAGGETKDLDKPTPTPKEKRKKKPVSDVIN